MKTAIEVTKTLWTSASIIGLLALSASYFAPKDIVLQNIPVCLAKRAGGSCILCGMTRAFFAISEGNFSLATEMNPYSIPLYAFLFLSLASQVSFLLFQSLKKWFLKKDDS